MFFIANNISCHSLGDFVFFLIFFFYHVVWATPLPRVTESEQSWIYAMEEELITSGAPQEQIVAFQLWVARKGGRLNYRQIMPEGGTSHWLEELHPTLHDYQSTTELPTYADVVIIGTGLAGAGAAEKLSDRAHDEVIVVLDARGVAEGATGQNGGNFQPMPESFITKYEGLLEERFKFSQKNFPDLSEEELRVMARQQGQTLIAFGRENGKLFKSLVEKYNLDPHISDAGWMRLANSAEEEAKFHSDIEVARSMGVYFEFWSAEKIQSRTPIRTEFGGRFAPGYGNYHPYEFVTQLFEHLLQKGIRLYTQTRVTKIEWNSPIDQPILVRTERGDILAKKVIVATDAYTAKLIPEMESLIEPFQSQVVTYEHVPDILQGWTLTERDGDLYINIPKATKYVDENGNPFGMKLGGGGPDRFTAFPDNPPLSQEMFDVIMEQMVYRFPFLEGRPVSNTWTAVFAFTPLRLPYLDYITHDGILDSRLVVTVGSQGYGGGMSLLGGHLAGGMVSMNPLVAEEFLKQYDPHRFFRLPGLTTQILRAAQDDVVTTVLSEHDSSLRSESVVLNVSERPRSLACMDILK